jgi:hypothetical protein
MRVWVLVERAQIKDDYLSPSALELYDTMATITNCAEAISHWHPDWTKCPVCHCEMDETGMNQHVRVMIN